MSRPYLYSSRYLPWQYDLDSYVDGDSSNDEDFDDYDFDDFD